MGNEIGGGGLSSIAAGIGQGISNFATHSARAAGAANAVSAAAQSAQGAFNQGSANNANSIAADRIAQQYGFNSASVAAANQFSMDMWQRTADFNAEEAEKQRKWLERMDNTKYQRAITDMSAAGLNPILAVTGGGISTGTGGGSAASISPVTGQAASGGLLQGVSASEGNYTGQMEYMGGMLGLLSAAIGGISSAMSAMGGMGKFGESLGEAIGNIFNPKTEYGNDVKNFFYDRQKFTDKYKDQDSGFNRYYNPSSKWYIGNR